MKTLLFLLLTLICGGLIAQNAGDTLICSKKCTIFYRKDYSKVPWGPAKQLECKVGEKVVFVRLDEDASMCFFKYQNLEPLAFADTKNFTFYKNGKSSLSNLCHIEIGMYDYEVIHILGRPLDINKTVSRGMISEQWLYGEFPNEVYLYFENDVLISWQY